jgi:tol-pal system protein YbgF
MNKIMGSQARKIVFVAALACGVSAAANAGADDPKAAASLRLARDQATLQSLDAKMSSVQKRAQKLQVADLFGPSDEEKAAAAAAAQHEQSQDSNIATLNQRASELEDSMRRLTGQIEVLNHRLDEMDQRIERLRKEFDYKLCGISAQQLGAAAGSPNAVPCAPPSASSSGADSGAGDTPSTGVVRLAPPPGVLGTLPPGTPMPQSSEPPPPDAPAVAAPSQPGNPETHAQFQAAMDMLAKSQYDEARAAFRNFADTYPKDPLSGQALYWLGDIAYVQKDYPTAARTFAEALKKFPQSGRGPESMLKLGQSLIAMNQKAEGCTALAALPSRYPAASKSVTSQADAVRKAGGCRH